MDLSNVVLMFIAPVQLIGALKIPGLDLCCVLALQIFIFQML